MQVANAIVTRPQANSIKVRSLSYLLNINTIPENVIFFQLPIYNTSSNNKI
jgi:hypothetical protein